MRNLLRSCTGCDAGAFARRIKSVVLEFQEGFPRDDLAILVLRVRDQTASSERGQRHEPHGRERGGHELDGPDEVR